MKLEGVNPSFKPAQPAPELLLPEIRTITPLKLDRVQYSNMKQHNLTNGSLSQQDGPKTDPQYPVSTNLNLQQTVTLAQAFIMTANIKEVAGVISAPQVTSLKDIDTTNEILQENGNNDGTTYFQRNHLANEFQHLVNSTNHIQQVTTLLQNFGPQDKASTFLLEQQNLERAFATEGKEMRRIIKKNIIDQNDYQKVKEQIALVKHRVKGLLYENDCPEAELDRINQALVSDDTSFSDEETNPSNKEVVNKIINGNRQKVNSSSSPFSSETQEDSGQNADQSLQNLKQEVQLNSLSQIQANCDKTMQNLKKKSQNDFPFIKNENKIKKIIEKIRTFADVYLSPNQNGSLGNSEELSLTQISKRLRINENFQEYLQKNSSACNLSDLKDRLKRKLRKRELKQKIQQLEVVLGLEDRFRKNDFDNDNSSYGINTIELDAKPLTQSAQEIQQLLFSFCQLKPTYGQIAKSINMKQHQILNDAKKVEKYYGSIRKIPANSSLLSNYGEALIDLKDNNDDKNSKQQIQIPCLLSSEKYVRFIGLEPHKLFRDLSKYRVRVDRLPKFSSIFDSVESTNAGQQAKLTLQGQALLAAPSASTTQAINYQRIDGKQVISLHFNPYLMNEETEDLEEKKQCYEQSMKEINDYREKTKNTQAEIKQKLEAQNLRRAWLNIVKKDIPKAYRLFQKFKADQETNTKKLSQNCLREVRKRAVKTQRLAKESVVRARKLTKEMLQFWRKRDRELADTKRKKERLDKELKKKQQEEEEALLQKKRLEYLMQQSEIYAHFMAKKLGVSEDLQKGKSDSSTQKQRVEIDQKAARKQIAGIINENMRRLDEFDSLDREEVNEDDLQIDFDFQKTPNISIQAPKIFKGDLKPYQLKGLQWLDNLYEQGINGILADEMGLGKTIQAISLMAHLAEKKKVWGPFLVIVPVSTLHNWQNELAQFCPDLRVLPYFGSAEERNKLAKFLNPKNMGDPAYRVHVVITSYNLIVSGGKDQCRLQRIKWHYMILDEAQAIKNNASRRWKTLLGFNTRNRLLLSGTPIQNSMAELWALLHFIMPKLFDNHEQFQEWFSKDIEQHSMDQGELNKHQLRRLHLILQPFMLRRLKKDVEQEIAPKIEELVYCDMTHRQRILYHRIKSKISAQDLFMLAQNKAKVENLMNLVMQFRKVCNHPDLFERRIGKIPYVFAKLNFGVQPNMLVSQRPEVFGQYTNPIEYQLPRMIYDECFFAGDNHIKLFTQIRKGVDISFSTVSVQTHFKFFNIFNEEYLYRQNYGDDVNQSSQKNLSILSLLSRSNNWSFSDLAYLAVCQGNEYEKGAGSSLISLIALMHFYQMKNRKYEYQTHNLFDDKDEKSIQLTSFGSLGFQTIGKQKSQIDIVINSFMNANQWSILYQDGIVENTDSIVEGDYVYRPALIPFKGPIQFLQWSTPLKKKLEIYFPNTICEAPYIYCSNINFIRENHLLRKNPLAMKVMFGQDFKPARDQWIGKVKREQTAFLTNDKPIRREESDFLLPYDKVKFSSTRSNKIFEYGPPSGYQLLEKGILNSSLQKRNCTFQLPDYSRLVTDCAKMQVLADLLKRLNSEGHRCLIFCQMTRMMDILEDFLIWQKYSYFRMDGSTLLQDRKFMVQEFQSNPNVFVFILSTRAGGLGITLTAADTVIFYDNDWNPTMDSQAADRAHRIGQNKTVHVYRLVTRNTVEERILRRARQKESVQSTVYGANLKADSFGTRDVVDMIIDDIDDQNGIGETDTSQVKGFIKGGASGGGKKIESRKRKVKSDLNDQGLYNSIPHLPIHDKFENEFDTLVKEMGLEELVEKLEIEENLDQQEKDNGQSIKKKKQVKLDKKQILSMLDRNEEEKKVVFRFEEDDIEEQKPKKKKEGKAEQWEEMEDVEY